MYNFFHIHSQYLVSLFYRPPGGLSRGSSFFPKIISWMDLIHTYISTFLFILFNYIYIYLLYLSGTPYFGIFFDVDFFSTLHFSFSTLHLYIFSTSHFFHFSRFYLSFRCYIFVVLWESPGIGFSG